MFDMNHLFIDSCIEIIFHIQYISDTAAHAGCEVFTCSTKNSYTPACHIFTSVISDTFHNSCCAGVTHCKSFSCHTVDEYLTTCRTVECNVTDDDILFGFITDSFRRIYDKFTT